MQSSLAETDLQRIKKEVRTYAKSAEEKAILNGMVQTVAPIMRLPADMRRVLIDAFTKVEIVEGQRVVDAGEPADSFFMIASGQFNLDSPEVNEGRSSLGRYMQGHILGERVLYVAGVGRTAFTVTCEEAGVLYVLPKAAFFALRKHVDEGVGVAGSISEFFSSLPACAGASVNELKELTLVSTVFTRSLGHPILLQGDPCDGVMILRAGTLAIRLPRPADLTGSANHQGGHGSFKARRRSETPEDDSNVTTSTVTFNPGDVRCQCRHINQSSTLASHLPVVLSTAPRAAHPRRCCCVRCAYLAFFL